MKNTKIEWCDSTLNFWSGCTKVSAGCANCYAEALSNRKLGNIGQWGNGSPRKLHESAFKQALALNRKPWVCNRCGDAFAEKQMGQCSCPTQEMRRCGHDFVKSKKGEDPAEWPEELRVREFPEL